MSDPVHRPIDQGERLRVANKQLRYWMKKVEEERGKVMHWYKKLMTIRRAEELIQEQVDKGFLCYLEDWNPDRKKSTESETLSLSRSKST